MERIRYLPPSWPQSGSTPHPRPTVSASAARCTEHSGPLLQGRRSRHSSEANIRRFAGSAPSTLDAVDGLAASVNRAGTFAAGPKVPTSPADGPDPTGPRRRHFALAGPSSHTHRVQREVTLRCGGWARAERTSDLRSKGPRPKGGLTAGLPRRPEARRCRGSGRRARRHSTLDL